MHVKDLRFHYRGFPDAIKGVSFDASAGEFLAVLGNNGAGKSTLLKCINRILKADSGEVLLDGKDLLKEPLRKVAQNVAFVSQHVPNARITVHDAVMLGRRPYMQWGFSEHDHEIVHEVMERLNLVGDIQGRFLDELSGGERQKVMLARALTQKPKVLLLDEPTSSLDIKNQYQVLQIVRDICDEDGITAIIVIHDLSLALRFCDRFLLMKEGEVYRYGDLSVLNEEALREVYDVRAHLVEVENRHVVLVES